MGMFEDPFKKAFDSVLGETKGGVALEEKPLTAEEQEQLEKNKEYYELGADLEGITDRHRGGFAVEELSREDIGYTIEKNPGIDATHISVLINSPIKHPTSDRMRMNISIDKDGKILQRSKDLLQGWKSTGYPEAIKDTPLYAMLELIKTRQEEIKREEAAKEAKEKDPFSRKPQKSIFDNNTADRHVVSEFRKQGYFGVTAEELPPDPPKLPSKIFGEPSIVPIATEKCMVDVSYQEYDGAGMDPSYLFYFSKLKSGRDDEVPSSERVNFFRDAVLIPVDKERDNNQRLMRQAYEAIKYGVKMNEAGEYEIDKDGRSGATATEVQAFLQQMALEKNIKGDLREFYDRNKSKIRK